MTAYPPKTMAVVCILMEAEAAHLPKDGGPSQDETGGLTMKIGLLKIPSKSTIWRAYGMIPEPYLREVHTRIIGDVMVTGSVAGDSTGYSSNRFVRWFSIRHDQVRLKRGWVKLHSIVDVSTSRPRLPGHRRVHLRHHRIVADAGKDRRRRRLLLPGFGLPGKEDLRRDSCQGHGTAHPGPNPNRLQELGQPGLG